MTNRLAYREQLDAVLAEKRAMEQRRWTQEVREEEEGKMFAQAKRVGLSLATLPYV